MKKKAIIVSGYFNLIHKGHLEYFQNAKTHADYLFVIVNSDHQRELKGSKAFQEEEERMIIVNSIKGVDKAVLSIDQDRTVCETIKKIVVEFGDQFQFAFANGGDQNNDTIPEKPICEQLGVLLIDGLGDKIQSSSWLLNKAKKVMICIKADIPEEICKINDELKAIYHSKESVCIWIFKTVLERNSFMKETAGMNKKTKRDSL